MHSAYSERRKLMDEEQFAKRQAALFDALKIRDEKLAAASKTLQTARAEFGGNHWIACGRIWNEYHARVALANVGILEIDKLAAIEKEAKEGDHLLKAFMARFGEHEYFLNVTDDIGDHFARKYGEYDS